MHCCLYNVAIANRKTQYQRFNHSVDYFEQQNSLPEFKQVWTEYKKLGSQTLQATLKRVDFAFKRFFKGLGKYPKFKASRHYSGWDYPNKQSWKVNTNNGINGYLNLRDLDITVQMRGKARTWGVPKTCTVFWRNGKWYASITVECCPGRLTGLGAIGLDFGSKVAIATSDGELIESPKFLKRAMENIAQLSKGLRRKRKPEKRKVKASRRWKKCQAQINKVKRKVANQRQDWTHKVAAQIVSGNSLVATEKLNLKGMTRKAKKGSKRKCQKAGLNRNLLDVAIGMLRESIKYKVVEAGGVFLEAPTKQLKPTQRCNECWELTPKTLSDRLHICSNKSCGHTADRDINSAQVCLTWARGLERASLDAESRISTDCGSMKQMWAKKRY
ncbi:transposase [Lyngbya sp. PCC 8106]|nr:transposase [Lyngbya sp. PCC 8106]